MSLLVNKSQVLQAFKHYKAMIENQTGLKIKSLQTDNGREYLSTSFTQFLQENGITHRLSCPYSHKQNGTM